MAPPPTTLSSFRINYPPGTPYSDWDRARQDMVIFNGTDKIELEAKETGLTTYNWQVISAPKGASVGMEIPIDSKCLLTLDTRGGYLVRLTVNEGLPDQSRTTLYLGIASEGSSLCYPALGETIQDNSKDPFTGVRGTEEKLIDLFKWNEKRNSPWIRVKNTNYTVTEADDGMTFMATVDGIEFQLPVLRNGFRCTVFCLPGVSVSMVSENPGTDIFNGPWYPDSGTWDSLGIDQASFIIVEGLGSAGSGAWVTRGEGSVRNFGGSGEWHYGSPSTGGFVATGEIYVDKAGSDTAGNGLPGNPYESLWHAMGTVSGTPGSIDEFMEPCTFIVGAGTFDHSGSGNLKIPHRQNVSIVGRNCVIMGDIDWDQDPDDWNGENPLFYPRGLIFSSAPSYPMHLLNGTLTIQNVNPSVTDPVSLRNLYIERTLLGYPVGGNGFRIYQKKSGGTTASEATKQTLLTLFDAQYLSPPSQSWIFAEGELNGSGEAFTGGDNSIGIAAVASIIPAKICGNIRFMGATMCGFAEIDYTTDPNGDPYLGSVGGGSTFGAENGFSNCSLAPGYGPFNFGYDSSDPAAYVAEDLRMDANTLSAFNDYGSFNLDKVSVIRADMAFGVGVDDTRWTSALLGTRVRRGGLQEALDSMDQLLGSLPRTTTIVVHHGADAERNFNNFLAKYAEAAAKVPSATNQIMLVVPPGEYEANDSTGSFTQDTDYIHIVSFGSCRRGPAGAIIKPLARFYGSFTSPTTTWNVTCRNSFVKSVVIETDTDESFALEINDATGQGDRLVFQDVCLVVDAPSTPGAVLGSSSVGMIKSTFEDCHTDAIGFIYDCDFDGTLRRVIAKGVANVACSDSSSDRSVGTSAVIDDCEFGNYSCGFSAGGEGKFRGKSKRTIAGECSYGSTDSGTAVYSSEADCEDVECGQGSFGKTGLYRGKTKRCAAPGDSFGNPNFAGAEMKECTNLDRTVPMEVDQCILEECKIAASTGDPIKAVGSGARLTLCEIRTAGSYSVTCDSAFDIRIRQCALNADIHGDLTNLIPDGKNVVSNNI